MMCGMQIHKRRGGLMYCTAPRQMGRRSCAAQASIAREFRSRVCFAWSASAARRLARVPGGLGAIAAALAASPIMTLPGWARTRSAQFDLVAREAAALADSPDPS
jgi:hypothetical protein